jgi:hypothetical protein
MWQQGPSRLRINCRTPKRRGPAGVLLFFRDAAAKDDDGGFGKLEDVVGAGGDG